MPFIPIAVSGTYASSTDADHAVCELLRRSSSIMEVSALGQASVGATVGPEPAAAPVLRAAAWASLTGALVGGLSGCLAGLHRLALPLFSSFLAGGPVVAAVAGLVCGAMAGGLIGGAAAQLMSAAGRRHEDGRRRFLLSVHCESPDDIRRAVAVLEQTGAADIDSQPDSDDQEPAGLDAFTIH